MAVNLGGSNAALVELPRLRAGGKLGKYRIVGLLGKGGMGLVLHAEDTLLKRDVAIKFLPEGVAVDAPSLARLLQEARRAARLNDPHVIAIYKIDRHQRAYYLVMELAEGGSAQDFLTHRGALLWLEATQIAIQACQGLAAAHAAGLIHRDIKPANILRRRDGLVKLADFGLAKIIHQQESSLSDGRDPVIVPVSVSSLATKMMFRGPWLGLVEEFA